MDHVPNNRLVLLQLVKTAGSRIGAINQHWERSMSTLSKRSIEALVDLVEIKLSCLDVFDREDAREKGCLENARRELIAMMAAKRVMAPATASAAIPEVQVTV
ncbi:MAG: hypothetical protein ACREEE_15460 [Dongiaceae bacterium]